MHDRLKEVGGPDQPGRASGASLFVRRLIYRELREPLPKQWGKEAGPLNDMLSALADIEQYERDNDVKKALSLYRALLDSVDDESDLILRNLTYTMIGRLTPMLIAAGALKLNENRTGGH
ncbi:MAG: hypothetical protein KC800_30430 [Candidatus Eremiobacteraeota bacterium]|nr:hypothetical protein [Candidatus Eremiobacteraeota bacterium]